MIYKDVNKNLFTLKENQKCPNCKNPVQENFNVCPICKETLKRKCPGCQERIDITWRYCPYCEQKVDTGEDK